MPTHALFVLACAAALGSAIVGGIFYAFSSFVMRALARLTPEQGIAAMNSINVVVVTPSFMAVFAGTALASVALALGAGIWWRPASSPPLLAGALLYALGSFGLTLACNQPMNLRLAALAPAEALAWWPGYLRRWTFWNHVRTAASLGASMLMVAALLLEG